MIRLIEDLTQTIILITFLRHFDMAFYGVSVGQHQHA